ncbi:MAG: hypothetical protein QOC80_3157 [Frankiaceae bacterium]|jgi:hypothetical protein|nr:hypothetical protein [Frankiaceae bacterium]
MSAPERPFSLPNFDQRRLDQRRRLALRRCLLAVTVLHDLDLDWQHLTGPTDPVDFDYPDLTLDGDPPVRVPSARLRTVLAGRDLEQRATVTFLARWLLLRRVLESAPADMVLEALRVVGLPAGHALHPGPGWVRERVPGASLHLGLGLLPDLAPGALPADLTDDSDLLGGNGSVPAVAAPSPVPLPDGLLDEIGIDAAEVWPTAMARLEELGALAAARRRRRPRDPLRPLAEADVVTLLGSRRFRFELAAETTTGLAGLVVPMLNRGWVSTAAIDPAFGPAAAAATEEQRRGFARPVLVTEYEVVQVPAGGHPLRHLGGQKPRSRWS